MTGFEDDKLDMETEELEAKVPANRDSGNESFEENIEDLEDTDEFADDDDLEANFKPGKNPGLDSVEIDVEQLLSEIAAEASATDAANVRVRKRLEAMLERKRRHQDLIDFDEYDLES